ncbi:MAG: potassium channel family protein [Acidobacteria bacterium]|nr:potassium channel family protein [Acidobacteriota bacterium]
MTLTTLGYGDITPVAGYARALVALESLTGVFFLAILVRSSRQSLQADRKLSEIKSTGMPKTSMFRSTRWQSRCFST